MQHKFIRYIIKLPHFYERVRVKKLAHEYKIRLASWNIGSLTGKLAELVDVMVDGMLVFCVCRKLSG